MKRLCHKLLLLFDDRFNWIPTILFSISGLLLVVYMLYNWFPSEVVTIYNEEFHNTSNSEALNTGQIGDTIGGTLGPFVGLIAAMLTGMAFWVQYRANQDQRRDLKIERFENKFFELLKIHREIVADISVSKSSKGVRNFVNLFYEFRFTYYCVKEALFIENLQPKEDIEKAGYYEEEEILKIAFTIFFMGVGPNSNKLVMDILKNPLRDNINESIVSHINKKISEVKKWPSLLKCKAIINSKETPFEFNAYYKPFQGHQNKLGHYYRHLYQIIKYVDSSEMDWLDHEKKYAYVKIVRGQMSTYEQIMIYYNSFATFGKVWYTDDYLIRYRLIRNAALPIMDFGVPPKVKLKDKIIAKWNSIDNYFEWDEMAQRN